MNAVRRQIAWPRKYDVFGVGISATNYDDAVERLAQAAVEGVPAVASFFAVHAVMEAHASEELRRKVNAFDIVTTDGQPVRWALSWLHGVKLPDRVYGPEFTLRICKRAAELGLPIYLYGGSPSTLEKLQARLKELYPRLIVAGSESPPFRPLTPEEDEAAVERINSSGAKLMLIGLGCPKQDHFAADHRDRINAVQLCVGAAFDFHAGSKPMAPTWMQQRGLEWLYRLYQEPRRLWKRYLYTNTAFLWQLGKQWVFGGNRRGAAPAECRPIAWHFPRHPVESHRTVDVRTRQEETQPEQESLPIG